MEEPNKDNSKELEAIAFLFERELQTAVAEFFVKYSEKATVIEANKVMKLIINKVLS